VSMLKSINLEVQRFSTVSNRST